MIRTGKGKMAEQTGINVVVVGLGYVGLPLAVALARHFSVTGLDIQERRIEELARHHDRTSEVEPEALKASTLKFTSAPADCAGADIYIVTVPTPVDGENLPDLGPVRDASETVARLLDPARSPIVVFESTVYPGVTEEICGPLIESVSGLVCGRDFFLGYSPERINPGDRDHTVDRIVKVIAGQTDAVTERLAALYGAITSAEVFRAASIRAAEAAKVIENAQRDINIAFMNEIAQIFAALDLSVWDVLDAARTKWNFLHFEPGLVGGHCISIDPYYLVYRAGQLEHDANVIVAGRERNEGMGRWVAERLHARRGGQAGSVLVLGLTFKENVPDLRNSRVIDVIRGLDALGHAVVVHDPLADPAAAEDEYGIALEPDALERTYDLVVAAVPHDEYRAFSADRIRGLVNAGGCVADLKGIWRARDLGDVERWSL
jgi:UDP-N-acetyl-D-galactosamine dehydrogenase